MPEKPLKCINLLKDSDYFSSLRPPARQKTTLVIATPHLMRGKQSTLCHPDESLDPAASVCELKDTFFAADRGFIWIPAFAGMTG
ncbi:MAG: hypothetical protein SFX19_01770 [Alphaproteobacteria bacterium]|nr:hypothetical protein [Alphaproteobacteria bacterium]